MNTLCAYLDGRWIDRSTLHVAVDDIGFLLGATVAERLRTFRGHVFRLEEHVRRLHHSLEIIGLPADSIAEEVAQAIPEFVVRNGQHLAPGDDWSIVAFVTPGVAGSGRPTVCVHGQPVPFHQWASLYDAGVPVVISSVRQVPPSCWPPELKCRSRMHYYLADREAAARQPGARAVLLDENGCVAEASTANVLIYHSAKGIVSPPREHILAGVSLGVVEELAAKLAVPFVVRPLTVAEFRSADEALLTSTSMCLLPIVACDGQRIGAGVPGPMFRRLLDAWSELVDIDVADQARQFADRSS